MHTLQWFLVHVFTLSPGALQAVMDAKQLSRCECRRKRIRSNSWHLTAPPPPSPWSPGTARHNISSCCCFRGCRRRCRAFLWQHFRCHRQNLRSERGTAPEGSHPWAFSIAAHTSRAGRLQTYTGWHLKEKGKQSSALLPCVLSFPVLLKSSQC